MAPLTNQDRNLIQHCLDDDWKGPEVVKLLLGDNRGTRTAIYNLIKRWKDTGTVIPAKGGRPRVITPAMRDFLEGVLAERSTY
ncbi:hypothetical protein CLAFUW4_12675 [Fulvia fulva]|uniref:Uncharacterized protein n=1 Tax=Passalora fulva TaxID=5499 RepID=A0A9Q8UVF6_PASFU|nr:uncharacterized protein CLAFUR5_12541 [Fulvia fulva]KAK4611590.1 hypothetical protein CLAFUR4_12680 [Fulvia fulva]UJO23936.1 hypothetical protein CLAFUR5_12541 [Fulvia fulva]WPV20825.1 hypothetical protein CLAFUW4_12675 [Fulvia fulva]WPV36194.1 hypothetical protein CLAFUW7_12682 [Fulvia fulva]